MKMKRILSLLLTLVMLCSLMPFSAWAEEPEEPAPELEETVTPAQTEENNEIPEEESQKVEEPAEEPQQEEEFEPAPEASLGETPETQTTPDGGTAVNDGSAVASVNDGTATWYFADFAKAAAYANNGNYEITLLSNVTYNFTAAGTLAVKISASSTGALTVTAASGFVFTQETTEGVDTYTCEAAKANVSYEGYTGDFATLDAAWTQVLAADTKAVTLRLLENVETSNQLALRNATSDYTLRNLTIDLNGKNITSNAAKDIFLLNRNGNLTIKGSGNVTSTNSKALAYLNSKNSADYVETFTINGGTYSVGSLFTGTGATSTSSATKATISITAGTFSVDPSAYLAEGYMAVKSGEKWVVQEKVAATVTDDTGAKNYDTLGKAIKAANAAGKTATIKVNEDVALSENVTVVGYLTIDLNGNTLAAGAYSFTVSEGCSLTIIDTEGAGKVTGTDVFVGTGTIELKGGTYSFIPASSLLPTGYEVKTIPGAEGGADTYKVFFCVAEVTVGEATAVRCESFTEAFALANIASQTSTIKLIQDCSIDSTCTEVSGCVITLDLNGKTLTGPAKAVMFKVNGTFTVNDTTENKQGKLAGGSGLTSTGTSAVKGSVITVNSTGSLTVSNGTIEGKSGASAIHVGGSSSTAYATASITGGCVTGKITVASKASQTGFISGGSFSDEPTASYLSSGIKALFKNGGMYSPKTSLKKAVDAANAASDASEIKLVDNCRTDGVTIDKSKTVTLDLNGQTISPTTDTNKRPLTVSGTLTVTDTSENKTGSIEGCSANSERGSVISVNSTGILNVNAGTIKKTSSASASAIQAGGTSSNGYATVSISGGTIIGGLTRANKTAQANIVSGGWFDESVSDFAVENMTGVKVADESKTTTPYTVTSTCGKIEYDVNDGYAESKPDDQTDLGYLDGYTVKHKSRTQTPVKSGSSFVCWNSQADGEGDDYLPGAEFDFTATSHEYKLYAQWTEVTSAGVTIGDKSYTTVGEAMFFVQDDDVIKLSGDITETITVPAGKKVTIDLNGHSITGSGIGSAINVKGELTITDSVGGGFVYGTAQQSGGAVDNSGVLTLESGTLKGTAPNYGAGVYNSGTFVMNGGSVIADTSAEGSTEQAIYSNNSSSGVNISAGEVIGTIGGKTEKYTITGGFFTEDPTSCLDAAAYCAYKGKNEDSYTVSAVKAKLVSTDSSRGYPDFEKALAAMTDESAQYIELYANVEAEYSISAGHMLKVKQGAYTLTVTSADEYCDLKQEMDGETGITTYTCEYKRLSAELKVADKAVTAVKFSQQGVITVKDGTTEKTKAELTFAVTEGASLIDTEKLPEVVPTKTGCGQVGVDIFCGSRSVSLSFTVERDGVIKLAKAEGEAPYTEVKPEDFIVNFDIAKANPKQPLSYNVKVVDNTLNPITLVKTAATESDITAIKAVSSDTKIATVKAVKGKTDEFTITLSTKVAGKCVITFTPYSGKTALTPVKLEVRIYDYAPRVDSEVTLNTFNEAATYITAVESYDARITDVKVMNVDKKGVPTDENTQINAAYADGFIAITSNDIIAKAFKCALRITTTQGDFDMPLSVKIKNAYPKITATQADVYKPYKDSVVYFNIAVSEGEIECVDEIYVSGFSSDGNFDHDTQKLKITAEDSKQASSGNAEFSLRGYRGTVLAKLSIKAVKKPSYALQYTALTVKAGTTEDLTFDFVVYDKNTKAVDTTAAVSCAETVEGVSADGRTLTVKSDSPLLAEKGKKTVKLNVTEGTIPTVLSYSFTVVDAAAAPAVKLKASTLTLNAYESNFSASTTYTVSQENVEYKFTPAAVDATMDYFDIALSNGVATASIKSENVSEVEALAGKTLKYNIAVEYRTKGSTGEYTALPKPIAISIKVINTAAAISFKTSGKLDVVLAESFMTLTPTVKNLADFEVTGVILRTADGAAEYTELDAAVVDGNVKLTIPDKGTLPGKKTFNVELKLQVKSGTEETDVTTSKPISVTVGQTALKVKADVSTATIYHSQGNKRTVIYTVRVTSPAGAKIKSATIGKIAALFRTNLADTGANIAFTVSGDGNTLKVYVTMDDNCSVTAGKSYTLPLVITPEGADNSGKACAKLNLTLKVMK